jgi:hypothetical protein
MQVERELFKVRRIPELCGQAENNEDENSIAMARLSESGILQTPIHREDGKSRLLEFVPELGQGLKLYSVNPNSTSPLHIDFSVVNKKSVGRTNVKSP